MDKYTIEIHYWSKNDQQFNHMTMEECVQFIDQFKCNDILSIEIRKELN